MNCYDFDQTIFYPDSSYCFVMYCLKKYPRAVLRAVPGAAWFGLKKLCGKAETKELKEKTFSFLRDLPDVEETVRDFWEAHRKYFARWYPPQKRTDDLILSASPEFLLRPAAEGLGVRLLGTRMDCRTGKIEGANCHGEEKVRRFRESFPGEKVEEFYSDSLSDTPMARLAERAFLVDRESLRPWPEKK